MNEKNLVQLINNISYKYSKTFTFNSKSTNSIFEFGNKLSLNKDYVYTLKLNSFSGWETLTNIDETKTGSDILLTMVQLGKILLFQKVFGDLHK